MQKPKQLILLAASCLLLSACGSPVDSSSSSQGQASSQDIASSQGTSSQASQASSQAGYDREAIEESIIIHYHREDNDYSSWCLWLWDFGKDGAIYNFDYSDDYGGIAVVPISRLFSSGTAVKMGLIVRATADWTKDYADDRYITFSEETADAKGNYEFWLYTEVGEIYRSNPGEVVYLSSCAFLSFRKLSAVAGSGNIHGLSLYTGETLVKTLSYDGVKTATMELDEDIDIAKPYSVNVDFGSGKTATQDVSPVALYDTSAFNEAYEYTGDDLGVTYTDEKTTFKVWSPVSTSIELKLYESGTPASLATSDHPGSDTPIRTLAMSKGEKGIWSVEVEGDLNGKYYTYAVTNYRNEGVEVVDPYAKAVGVNGLRGMILDLDSTNPSGWDEVNPHQIDRKALTVWECHIADLTSSSTWGGTAANAKKYAGFHEAGTTYTQDGVSVKTGFDHVKELGVNAVQILPMFDQANDETKPSFNWGYNPLNYNAPEGVYSSDPYDGAVRIRELKELIADYNEAGINIIMDVVYNHVNSVSGLGFDVLMPYYYFRYDSGLGLTNGSGCGNETASNHAMFAKFMIDSAAFWAKEYKLGGFRFDLMALHDLSTMKALTEKVTSINPGAVIYGEPWTGGSTPLSASQQASIANQSKFEGYGCFNDQIRDALIAGGLAAKTDQAWATYDTAGKSAAKWGGLQGGIKGQLSRSLDPDKAVTYASCHDNYTLYDRVKAAHGSSYSEETTLKMAELANAVVLTSQGTSFILSGEEMLRSKGGNDNSYNASYEVNALDYANKVAHPTLFADYVKLIALKQSLSGLHLGQDASRALEINHSDDYSLVWYDLPGDNGKTYRIAHANGTHTASADEVDFNGYSLYLATAGETSLSSATQVLPYQTIIASK